MSKSVWNSNIFNDFFCYSFLLYEELATKTENEFDLFFWEGLKKIKKSQTTDHVNRDSFRSFNWGDDGGDGVANEGAVDLLVGDVEAGRRQTSGGVLENNTIIDTIRHYKLSF